MRAVARLIWSYFMGTRLTKGLTVLGLLCLVAGVAARLYAPDWMVGAASVGDFRNVSLAMQFALISAPWLAILLLFAATVRMPAMLERFALGRQICILPHGRLRVLTSVVCTAGLISIIAASLVGMWFSALPVSVPLAEILSSSVIISFVTFGMMYFSLWALNKLRGFGLLLGLVAVIPTLLLTLSYITVPVLQLGWPIFAGLISWSLFGAVFLFGQRLKHGVDRMRGAISSASLTFTPPAAYKSGAETELLLETGRPWILAIGQVIPITIAAWFIWIDSVWLFYLTLFAAISGAMTCQAAPRSRRLWLRRDWTRTEIFCRVESAYWRQNAYFLGVLLLLFVGIGSYFDYPTPMMAAGIPLLVLTTLACAYLGLMMTRGLGWFEAIVTVLTLILLGAAGLAATDLPETREYAYTDLALVVELELLIGASALIYRFIAKSRWSAIDWMICKTHDRAAGVH